MIGLDLGLRRDASVAAVRHREHGVVTIDAMQVWTGSRLRPVRIEDVESWLVGAAERYRGAEVVADPWQTAQLCERLRRSGVRVSEYVFSAQSVGRLASTLREIAALAAEAARPQPPVRREEKGAIVLPREVLQGLRDGALFAVDVAVLGVVLCQLEAGALGRNRLEDGVLVVLAQGVLAGLDPDGDILHRERALSWLHEAGYLRVVRSGKEVRIGRGPLLAAPLTRRENTR